MPDSRRGHRSLPHTADVILEAWGPDLASCCEEAVAALAELYVDSGAEEAAVARRVVQLGPGTDESLLVDVLDEVIFTLDTAEGVPVRAELSATADGGLDMELVLADPRAVTPAGSVPKAVSRSGLRVERWAGGVRCRCLVDV